MKKIQILGPPGDAGANLAVRLTQAANELGVAYRLERILDEDEIMSHGVIVTPAVIIDGRLISVEPVPEHEDLMDLLR